MARLYLNDVAPRDGFQNEKTFIATADKIALIDALSRTGLAKIELTSFVSPKAIPALADAEAVLAGIARAPGVIYTVLVPNLRGAQHAVEARADDFGRRFPDTELTLHFHDTRGMALANVMAGVEAGALRFDASLDGLDGCPYAPGASGNACLEDMAQMLALCGHDTGVDLDALIGCARRLPGLIGHEVPGQIVKAGQRHELHPVPAGFDSIRQRAAERGIF